MTERFCFLCGNVISKDKRADTIYCSNQCGNQVRRRRHRENNKELYQQLRLKENANSQKRMYSRSKSRAKIRGIPWDLDLEDIIIPEYCPVLGIKLNVNNGRGAKNWPDSPSLDRIIPDLGYTKGNVRVISSRANLLKNNATINELELILQDLYAISDGHRREWSKGGYN